MKNPVFLRKNGIFAFVRFAIFFHALFFLRFRQSEEDSGNKTRKLQVLRSILRLTSDVCVPKDLLQYH